MQTNIFKLVFFYYIMLNKRYAKLGIDFKQVNNVKPTLRINTLKINKKELISRLKKKGVKLEDVLFLKHGFYFESDFSLGATPEYLLGYYYLQEAASQLPPIVLDPKEGELVLDMAAAPGSKTTYLAQLMNNKGKIYACDSNSLRLRSLQNNLERLGVTNTIIFRRDARFIDDLDLSFDKILLDAPCSGNFCVNPNYYIQRTLQDINMMAEKQKQLVKTAFKLLKKEGVLVYSTCSLEPEENEMIVDYALSLGFKLEDTGLNIGDPGFSEVFGLKLKDMSKTRRFWPHKHDTEGFFIAKLRK